MDWAQKLQRGLFCLLIILLPSQLGAHFWPRWSFVNGVRIDYFSPTLYLTDLLILLLCLLVILNFKFKILNEFSIKKFLKNKFYWVTGVLVLLALLNVWTSLSPAVSVYKWLKVLEFGFLAFWLSRNRASFPVYKFTSLLLIPVLYESILAIGQFFSQGSIGGVWYFLGERTFNSGTPGIANAFLDGQLVLRPYGTFPHPNVLGGFLAVILPLILLQFLHNSRSFTEGENKLTKLIKLIEWATIGLGYIALFLSLSRAAVLVGILASSVAALPSLKKVKLIWPIWLIGLIGGILLIWPRVMSLKLETEPIVVREQLNNLAIKSWVQSPIVGTGLGTAPLYSIENPRFKIYDLRNYALAYQPTHNIYLLLLAETGLVGLSLFGLVVGLGIRRLWQRKDYLRLTPLVSILVLGLFDHYFLTLQQGQLLLALVISISWASRPES